MRRLMLVLGGGVALALLWGSPQVPSGAQGDSGVGRGGELFQSACAACHGTAAEGGTGSGLRRGPPLVDVSLTYVDLTLRTGRMPVANASVGVFRTQLDEGEREALLAYMMEAFALDDDRPVVGPGDAARGHEAYVRNCAACHGATGTGGIIGGGTRAPAIDAADPVIVAQAVRAGPFAMPGFTDQALTEQQVNDIVAYLRAVDTSARTPLGLREIDPVGGGIAAVVLAAVTLVAAGRLLTWWSPGQANGRETRSDGDG